MPDRRRARAPPRRRPRRRLLRPADGVRGPQQDADLPGGDLRPGRVGHDLRGRGRGARDRQRHLYGLGAGVWTRDGTRAPTVRPRIQAGRVWTNCYHAYPAHAAFGGYKQSGIGRETHKMMLDHYQQTKNRTRPINPIKNRGGPVMATMRGRRPRIRQSPVDRRVPIPSRGRGEIRVAIGERRLPCTDLHAAEGDWLVKPNPPFIPGHEGSASRRSAGRAAYEGRRPGRRALALHRLRPLQHCLGGWETLCVGSSAPAIRFNGGFADLSSPPIRTSSGICRATSRSSRWRRSCVRASRSMGAEGPRTKPGDWVVISRRRRARPSGRAICWARWGSMSPRWTSPRTSSRWPASRRDADGQCAGGGSTDPAR